jgi:hypothetical protein
VAGRDEPLLVQLAALVVLEREPRDPARQPPRELLERKVRARGDGALRLVALGSPGETIPVAAGELDAIDRGLAGTDPVSFHAARRYLADLSRRADPATSDGRALSRAVDLLFERYRLGALIGLTKRPPPESSEGRAHLHRTLLAAARVLREQQTVLTEAVAASLTTSAASLSDAREERAAADRLRSDTNALLELSHCAWRAPNLPIPSLATAWRADPSSELGRLRRAQAAGVRCAPR